jgi:hypothetical protein
MRLLAEARHYAMLLVLAALAVGPAQAQANPTGVKSNITVCAHFSGHLYEACFAYLINDSGIALRNFYANAHSADSSQAGDSLEDFHYRFRGQARTLITGRVAKWPKGRNIVGIPTISIVKASSSLVTNTARLTTRETWRVVTSAGKVLYSEPSLVHHITMARVRGKFLHIWVVTSIT